MEEQWERPMECERRRRRRPQETTQETMCDQLAGDAGDDGVHPGENVGTGDDTQAWRLGGERSLEEQWKQEIGLVSHLLQRTEQNIRFI
jgi:hypothetical protein